MNNSFVNKLNKVIPNPRINCRRLGLGKIDYNLLMNNPYIECKVKLDRGRLVEEETDPMIVKYCELNSNHHFSIDNVSNSDKSKSKNDLKYELVRNEMRNELSKFGYSDVEVADILIKFLYDVKNSRHKDALWLCYGDIIVENLERYFKPQTKAIQCVDCGEWIEVGIFDSKTDRCEDCYKEYRKNYYREKKREQRLKKKMSTDPLS